MPLLPALVTALALALYLGTVIAVMRARGHYGIAAPATSGHPVFERLFRIQQNTLEQLVLFLPALWLYSLFVSSLWGAAIGLVWLLARLAYAVGYARDPAQRGPGMIVSFFAAGVLLAGGLVGVLAALR
jgi:hypothetical protein